MMTLSYDWLPTVFVVLMAVSLLVYAVLDGYDLGVGVLLPYDNQLHRDDMIYSIGPFWDANETWLVLAIGLLLIAFPKAHSIIFQALYMPTAVMLIGLILRGVSFDFRTKGPSVEKRKWDLAFKIGSLIATLAQGYMLGRFVTGFEDSLLALSFSVLASICVTAGYCFIGSAWLVMKTEGELQKRAAKWASYANILMNLGILAVCVTNLLIDNRIMEKWLAFPQVLLLIPLTFLFIFSMITVQTYLKKVPLANDTGCWYPFINAVILFTLSFLGLGYSFYPYIVPNQMTIYQAASSQESLIVIFWGAAVVLPMIVGYTVFSYKVFSGKTSKLNY